ncbi:uncharacterized protein LOC110716903 [Chenopodium quinoa]|uniref:Retrotransposon Copia-like N-terminal domain-containing protein n=1 Tax=Chenopodium quinoa TaxID=63459 RepID=A0A803MD36_CHEQI|nr:uncharacterized protein LOC110716903 [Chenopodium quinoa]
MAGEGVITTPLDFTNPLYLHPSNGTHTIAVSKLTGSSNYQTWQRSMEIALSSKCKLGFVTRTVQHPAEDPVKAELWDICNATVIGWIHASVSDSIKSSILFLSTSRMIWSHLKKQFSLTNGSCKYKISRDLIGLRQNGAPVHEYYIHMRDLWQELESMSALPAITTTATDVPAFLRAMERQQEESRLF